MIDVRRLTGEALGAALDDVARLRIEVFRAFPYLYDGDAEYDVDVPYTVGEWKSTSTTQISLGANGAKIVLKRKDGDGRCFGLAIKEIVLTKVVDSGSEPEYVIVAQEE